MKVIRVLSRVGDVEDPFHVSTKTIPGNIASNLTNRYILFNKLLEEPSGTNATALFQRVRDFRDWGVTDLDAYTWFMTDVEWAWMSGDAPMEDW